MSTSIPVIECEPAAVRGIAVRGAVTGQFRRRAQGVVSDLG